MKLFIFYIRNKFFGIIIYFESDLGYFDTFYNRQFFIQFFYLCFFVFQAFTPNDLVSYRWTVFC